MQESRKKENVIVNKSIEFAILIIEFCEMLEKEKKFVIAKQLLRCGTSVGANIHEAQNCESRRDFIHKMKIAAKELEESKYWMILCESATTYPKPVALMEKQIEISRILNKIITTANKHSYSVN